MVTAQDAVLILVGIFAAFAGYSIAKNMMPLWGFIMGGYLAYLFLPMIMGAERASQLPVILIGILIGGAIGALISRLVYFVIIFLGGMALGMLIGVLIGAVIDVGGPTTVHALDALLHIPFPPVPQSTTQFLLMMVFGLVMGGLAVAFQKFMICASSAFIGAYMLVTGLAPWIGSIALNDTRKASFMMLGWMILGLAGMFVQTRTLEESGERV